MHHAPVRRCRAGRASVWPEMDGHTPARARTQGVRVAAQADRISRLGWNCATSARAGHAFTDAVAAVPYLGLHDIFPAGFQRAGQIPRQAFAQCGGDHHPAAFDVLVGYGLQQFIDGVCVGCVQCRALPNPADGRVCAHAGCYSKHSTQRKVPLDSRVCLTLRAHTRVPGERIEEA